MYNAVLLPLALTSTKLDNFLPTRMTFVTYPTKLSGRGCPEKWKERQLKWRAKGAWQNFQLINGCVNCFVSIHVLLQCYTTIMKRMKQATLFGFFAVNMLIILCLPCLNDWFASHHTLCLQEWFVQVNQRMLKQRISIMDTADSRGVASHPIHPPWISPCKEMV